MSNQEAKTSKIQRKSTNKNNKKVTDYLNEER